jgi:hypothetical protein
MDDLRRSQAADSKRSKYALTLSRRESTLKETVTASVMIARIFCGRKVRYHDGWPAERESKEIKVKILKHSHTWDDDPTQKR